MKTKLLLLAIQLFAFQCILRAQQTEDPSQLTLERIHVSGEFVQKSQNPIQWIEGGAAYVTIEPSENTENALELVRYNCKKNARSILVPAENLIPEGRQYPLHIEDFTFSHNGRKVLIFNNSSRVWRSNTKGDYWVFDLDSKKLF